MCPGLPKSPKAILTKSSEISNPLGFSRGVSTTWILEGHFPYSLFKTFAATNDTSCTLAALHRRGYDFMKNYTTDLHGSP
jgi:hypothetical protein